MKKNTQSTGNLNLAVYGVIFSVTQITGLLLSLIICFILQDFIWGFVRLSLFNSLLLGCTLIGSCWLSQKLLFRIRTGFLVLISLSLILGVGIISFVLLVFFEPAMFIYYNRGALSFLFINFLFIITLYIISSGLIIYREILLEKEKTIGMERELKNRMEMKLLSSKVSPHFLFNTLNMILNLLKQPEKAETAILNLSDLLRNTLENSEKTTIPLRQEIDNVRKYLELQKLRFGEKLTFSISADTDFPIPPLIIQPLIENSIKHNIRNVRFLEVSVSCIRNGNRGTIIIMDSEKKVGSPMLNTGQGLTLTKKRVENSEGTFLFNNGGIEISFNL